MSLPETINTNYNLNIDTLLLKNTIYYSKAQFKKNLYFQRRIFFQGQEHLYVPTMLVIKTLHCNLNIVLEQIKKNSKEPYHILQLRVTVLQGLI